MSQRRLIFIYNADSGLFNLLTDIAHKLISPQTYKCDLCALTHAPFAMRRRWRQFLEGLDAELEFLHRDEVASRFPGLALTPPAIVSESEAGPIVCVDAAQIGRSGSLEALERIILRHCLCREE
jgi:hypothetical protein